MAKGVSDLTINEIAAGNRKLPDSTDLETAIVEGGRYRFDALAVLAWLHARREDPQASLDTWRDKTPDQLLEYLGADEDTPEEGPTVPTS